MSSLYRQGNGRPLPTAHFEQEVRMTLKYGAPGSQAWYVCPSVQSTQGPQRQGPGVWPQHLLPVPPPRTACLQAVRSGPQHLSKEPASRSAPADPGNPGVCDWQGGALEEGEWGGGEGEGECRRQALVEQPWMPERKGETDNQGRLTQCLAHSRVLVNDDGYSISIASWSY